jgi:hypothetical protein
MKRDSIQRRSYRAKWTREDRKKNPLKYRLRDKNRPECQKEKRRAYHKQYYYDNKQRFIKATSLAEQKRLKLDPKFRLMKRLRGRMKTAIKGVRFSIKTFDLVGCGPIEFQKYIEGRFLPGMTWNNYGYRGWHVDHKKPISSFDLSTLEGQKAAFHYSNTQPLWAVDNLRKSDKVF